VWDASLFAGYSQMGHLVNVMLGIGVVLNILIQFTLCAIIAVELSVDAYDDTFLGHMLEWRKGAADAIAQRVCDEDRSLPTASFQAETYSATREFTSPWLSSLIETGPLLAVMVIFMWTLSVMDVLRGAIDFLMAAIHLHKQRASDRFTIGRLCTNEFTIEGVTLSRTVWAIAIGLLQLVIACCLLVSGALWLAYTKSIPDLLANAVALSYVMQVDELLYQVIVPRRAKALVMNLTPIDMSEDMATCSMAGVPKRAMSTLCLALGFLLVVILACVWPHAARMRQIRDGLCPI